MDSKSVVGPKVQPVVVASPDTMKAAYIVRYGNDQLQVRDNYPRPKVLQKGFVMIRVHCVSLQPSDCKTRNGNLKVLSGINGQTSGPDGSLKNSYVLGYDCAGTIVTVGPNVQQHWEIGDEVCCVAMSGALAEFTVVHESMLARKPSSLSFAHAAAFITAGLTASQAFRHAENIAGPLKTVLVTGGAGGVGSVAIQYAKHVLGVKVIASTASSMKIDFVRSCGADIVMDYKQSNWPTMLKTTLQENLGKTISGTDGLFDMVLDCTADAKVCQGLIRRGGELVCITTDRPDSIPSGAMVNEMLLAHRQPPLPCCVPTLLNFLTSSTSSGKNGVHRHNFLMLPTGLENIMAYAGDGRIKLTIDRIFSLSEASAAMDYVEKGHVTGRVIVECFPGAASGVVPLHP